MTIRDDLMNGRKNLHRWPRSVPSPSRLASLFKIFWCVNYIQVGSSPSNPMHAYSFWVRCGATSICDGTVYNLPQMGTHLPAWYMVWYMAHVSNVTLHFTRYTSHNTTKQRGNEKQDNVATKQRGNKTATQRSNEAMRQRSKESTKQRSNEATRQQGITHLPVLCLCGTWQTVQAKRQHNLPASAVPLWYMVHMAHGSGNEATWHTVQATTYNSPASAVPLLLLPSPHVVKIFTLRHLPSHKCPVADANNSIMFLASVQCFMYCSMKMILDHISGKCSTFNENLRSTLWQNY